MRVSDEDQDFLRRMKRLYSDSQFNLNVTIMLSILPYCLMSHSVPQLVLVSFRLEKNQGRQSYSRTSVCGAGKSFQENVYQFIFSGRVFRQGRESERGPLTIIVWGPYFGMIIQERLPHFRDPLVCSQTVVVSDKFRYFCCLLRKKGWF